MKIKTEYDPKPIPIRNFDWLAYDDATYDGPGCPVGSGATEQEAIADLIEATEIHEECVLEWKAREGRS